MVATHAEVQQLIENTLEFIDSVIETGIGLSDYDDLDVYVLRRNLERIWNQLDNGEITIRK